MGMFVRGMEKLICADDLKIGYNDGILRADVHSLVFRSTDFSIAWNFIKRIV
jgi:hypothetical protein